MKDKEEIDLKGIYDSIQGENIYFLDENIKNYYFDCL